MSSILKIFSTLNFTVCTELLLVEDIKCRSTLSRNTGSDGATDGTCLDKSRNLSKILKNRKSKKSELSGSDDKISSLFY